jgi:uncharacterized protein YjeT (DUF2065 family)
MDITIPLIVVAYVLVGFIAWQILKHIMGVVVTLVVFTIIISALFGFFVYRDIIDMKANLKNGNMVILSEENIALSGFLVVEGKGVVLTPEQLKKASTQIAQKEFKTLQDSSYKLFILTPQAIEAIPSPEFTMEGDSLTTDQALLVLRSSDAVKALGEFGISTDSTSEEAKAELLAEGFEQIIKDPVFMISQIKSKNLVVYPETALFKAMKYIPLAFIKSAVSKLVNETKEVGSDITSKVIASVKE